jgi:hypothetical protein
MMNPMLNNGVSFIDCGLRRGGIIRRWKVLELTEHLSPRSLGSQDGVRILRENESVNVFHDETLRRERATDCDTSFVIHDFSPSMVDRNSIVAGRVIAFPDLCLRHCWFAPAVGLEHTLPNIRVAA